MAPPSPREARNAPASSTRDRAGGRLQHGHAAALRQGAGPRLVAEELERLRARPDENQPGVGGAARRSGFSLQEAVAGMNGVAPAVAGGGEESLDVEVGGGADTAQRAGVVGAAHVQGACVVLGEHRHGVDTQLGGRVQDAHRDLAPVRYEKRFHGKSASTKSAILKVP